MFSERLALRVGGIPYDLGFSDGVLEFVNNELKSSISSIGADRGSGIWSGHYRCTSTRLTRRTLVAGFLYEDPESNHIIIEPERTGDNGLSRVCERSIDFGHQVFQRFGIRSRARGLCGVPGVRGSFDDY